MFTDLLIYGFGVVCGVAIGWLLFGPEEQVQPVIEQLKKLNEAMDANDD